MAPPPRPEPRADRRPRDATAVTQALRDRPAWEGEPTDDPSRARTTKLPEPEEDPSRARTTRLPRDDEATQPLWEDEDPPAD